jgi:hypothetical protein
MPFILAIHWIEAGSIKPSAYEIQLKDEIHDLSQLIEFLLSLLIIRFGCECTS